MVQTIQRSGTMGEVIAQASFDHWAAVWYRVGRQLGRAEPKCAFDAFVQEPLGLVPHWFGREGYTQKALAIDRARPEINSGQTHDFDLPAAFFQGFANQGIGQGFAVLKVSGGLVQHQSTMNPLFDEQKTAMLLDDGGNRHIGLPDFALGHEMTVWKTAHSIAAANRHLKGRSIGPIFRGMRGSNATYTSPMTWSIHNSTPADPDTEHQQGVVVEESRPELAKPPMYQVALLNDDYTPMDFVVSVLQMFFAMDHARATQVMLHVHTRGKGVCGVFTREVAETKVTQVNEFSRSHHHPLMCTMEKL